MENTNQVIQEEVEAATSEPITGLNAGATVKGKVTALKDEFAVVDFGAGFPAEVSLKQFVHAPKSGESFNFYIEELDAENKKVLLSKVMADRLKLWSDLQEAFAEKKELSGVVVAQIKGGYAVDIGTKAFLPNSQVDLKPLSDPLSVVDKKVAVIITKLDEKKGQIVVSRRPILAAERGLSQKALLSKLKEGDVVEGVVESITKYGAFLDIGGFSGLLHINDMSYDRRANVADIVAVGQKLKVKVLKIDEENQKVNLGLKQLSADPWAAAQAELKVGAILKGKVSSLTKYGAFIELFPGVEGLAHISTFSWNKRISKPSDALAVGDEVKVYILEVDEKAHRLSLSLKHVDPNPWELFAKEYPVNSHVKGVIKDIAEFGLFVDVPHGLTGLLHRSDISWTERNIVLGERFKTGDELEVVVLAIDLEKERLSLGLKQLTEDPWQVFAAKNKPGSVVTAKVKSIESFGAFLEIEPGFVGLCHVSELAEERVEDISSFLTIGQEVDAAILSVDTKKQKISLSMKAVKEGSGTLDYLADQNKTLGQLADIMPESLKKNS